MKRARRDGDKAAIGRGDIALAIDIRSPGDDRAINFETQAVTAARRGLTPENCTIVN